jgi:hypothetical protein
MISPIRQAVFAGPVAFRVTAATRGSPRTRLPVISGRPRASTADFQKAHVERDAMSNVPLYSEDCQIEQVVAARSVAGP